MTLLGIVVDSPLVSPWADQLALAKRAKFNVGVAVIADAFATAPENVSQLIDVLVPGPNGHKTIILRTDDAKFGATDIREQYVTRGFDDLVGSRPNIDWYLSLGNEPNMAGLGLAQHIAMLNDALTVKGTIGHGRLSWLVSLPTLLDSAQAIIAQFANRFEGIASHLYGDYRLGDGNYDWQHILDAAVASNHGVWITEANINDPATAAAVKAQRVLDYCATLPPRVVGLCHFTLGTGTKWSQYELTAAAADVYAARATPQPVTVPVSIAEPIDEYVDTATGYKIVAGMLARWKQVDAALSTIRPNEILFVVGRPLGNETAQPDGSVIQKFEFETWRWVKGQSPNRYDILVQPVGTL